MNTNKTSKKKDKSDVKASPNTPPNKSKGSDKKMKDPDAIAAVSEEDVLGPDELKKLEHVEVKREERHGKYQVGTFRIKE